MNDPNSSIAIAPTDTPNWPKYQKSRKIDYNTFTWPKKQLAFVYDNEVLSIQSFISNLFQ